MAGIVNLRQARKRRERVEAAAKAAENRAVYGLSKQQKAVIGSERARLLAELDRARLEPNCPPPERSEK